MSEIIHKLFILIVYLQWQQVVDGIRVTDILLVLACFRAIIICMHPSMLTSPSKMV